MHYLSVFLIKYTKRGEPFINGMIINEADTPNVFRISASIFLNLESSSRSCSNIRFSQT